MTQQVPIRFVYMRGGTSKAVFLRSGDLPDDPAARDRIILSLFGSPDPRQVDGLGGADILTSKLAIIGPSSRPDADLDYTFAQVSISEPYVSYDINCGNISSAVGVYAIEEGFVRPQEGTTTVRINNTNTRSILVADVPVEGGEAAPRLLPDVRGRIIVGRDGPHEPLVGHGAVAPLRLAAPALNRQHESPSPRGLDARDPALHGSAHLVSRTSTSRWGGSLGDHIRRQLRRRWSIANIRPLRQRPPPSWPPPP